jgi:hypothetical protein
MKSHDFAQALTILARLLKSGPDVELSQLQVGAVTDSYNNRDLALNLSTLVSLSSVNKQKWMELIRENGFPIEIRPRDASRDIFGKLCAYLESNPQAQEKLKASVNKTSGKSSPELMRALATLLKDQRTEPLFPDAKDQGDESPSE